MIDIESVKTIEFWSCPNTKYWQTANYLFAKQRNQNWSNFKAFADDKINENEQMKFGLGRVEKIVGIRENADYQYFLLFPQCFQKPSFSGSLKAGIVW